VVCEIETEGDIKERFVVWRNRKDDDDDIKEHLWQFGNCNHRCCCCCISFEEAY